MNTDENKRYRQPVENIGLPQATIDSIEQEANIELAKQPSPWQILHGAFGNINHWPESGVVPEGTWIHF
jgi:hypothetical protein